MATGPVTVCDRTTIDVLYALLSRLSGFLLVKVYDFVWGSSASIPHMVSCAHNCIKAHSVGGLVIGTGYSHGVWYLVV